MTHTLHALEAALQVAWTRRDPTPAEMELQQLPQRIPMSVHLVHAGRDLLLWLHDGGARKLAEVQLVSTRFWRSHHLVKAHHDFLMQMLHRQRTGGSKGATLIEWLVGHALATEGAGVPEPWHLLTTPPEAVEGWAKWVPRVEAVVPMVEWETDAKGGAWPIVRSLRVHPAPYFGLRGLAPGNGEGENWIFPDMDESTPDDKED